MVGRRMGWCGGGHTATAATFVGRTMQSGVVFGLRATLLSALLLSACGGSATDSASSGNGDGDGDGAGTGGSVGEGTGGMDSGDPAISSYCQGLLDIDATSEYEMYCADDPTYDPDVTPMEQTQGEFVEDLEQGWAAVEPLPDDVRPSAPDWNPPFELGEPGWRESTESFCQPFELPPDLIALWATDDAVFAATSRHCSYSLAASEYCDEVEGSAIYQNDGSGWTLLDAPALRLPEEAVALGDGRLLLGMDVIYDPETGATVLDNPEWDFDGTNLDLAAAGGHAVAKTSPMQLLGEDYQPPAWWELSGNTWIPIEGLELGASSMALDENGRIFLGYGDAILIGDSTRFEALEGTPAGEGYNRGIWGNAEGEVCAVNEPGQLVCFDGSDFAVETTIDHVSSRVQFAEVGERLYFLDDYIFGYLAEGEVTNVIELPPASASSGLTHLATNPSGEVFVSLVDSGLEDYACGSHVTLMYDGTELHRF